MSDFISELRREVVDAHGRHQRRNRPRRAARWLHPRAWRPAAALGAIAVAASLVAVVVGARLLAAPEPAPVRPHVVGVIAVGGTPLDAVFDRASLWVADAAGTVMRVDPVNRQVTSRITVTGEPGSIAAGTGGVWVATAGAGHRTDLYQIEPRTNRVVARLPAGGAEGVAVGANAVWSIRFTTAPDGIVRIDPVSRAVTSTIDFPSGRGIAVGGDAVWAIAHNGTVAQIDTARGRIVRRWPVLAPSSASGRSENVLAPELDGVWVLSTENAEIIRITAGRVAGRISIDPAVRPVLARARDGLWIATGDALGGRNHLLRIDPETGHVTATVDTGNHRPTALIAADDTLYVVTGDGNVLLIRS